MNRRGLTLLEMLLALVVCAMLMTGVLSVVTSLGAAGLAGAEPCTGPEAANAAVDAWVRQLRQDLACGTVETVKETELTIVGYSALRGTDHCQTHRPVRIVYLIEEIDGRTWVVRRQAILDLLTNQNVRRDLVCGGVRRFELVKSVGAAVAGLEAKGGSWRLRVWMRDQDSPSYDKLVLSETGGGE